MTEPNRKAAGGNPEMRRERLGYLTFPDHTPMGFLLEVNADGHVFGAPRDACFKSGAGGSDIYVVRSLDLAMYKMAASDAQSDPQLTGLPLGYEPDPSRDDWKPLPHDQFHDGPVGGDDGVRRLLEMVVAAVVQ